MNKSVLVIIPAFNEEETIDMVINNVKKTSKDFQIVVINDASNDRTSAIAKANGNANVVDLPINLGIGGAVQTGLKFASRNNFDYAVQFDADGQHNADDIAMLVGLIEKGECDVAVGSRFVGKNKFRETDLMRRLGIRLFETFSMLLVRKRVCDHTSGFRAFNRKSIEFIMNEYPVDYPEPEIIIYLIKNGFTVKEVFTQMFSRQGGVSSISFLQAPYYMIKVMIAMFMAAIRPSEN